MIFSSQRYIFSVLNQQRSYNIKFKSIRMIDLDFGDLPSDDLQLDDSVVREALGKTNLSKYQLSDIDGEPESKNELQSLIYTNLSLEYDIFLSEEELKYYKVILTDKESQIKRLKQMHAKKSSKLNGVAESIKRLKRKIKEVSEGYKVMMKKKEDSLLKEQNHRNERLTCQQKKNTLYLRYCELQQTHSEILAQIQNYQGYEAEYNEYQAQNQQIKQQIEQLQARKQQIEDGTPSSRKQELKTQIKKLYDKIKAAEKEELTICKEYQIKKKQKKHLQEEQTRLTQKSVELNSLYTRVAKLKEECKERKWVKLERQKEYHELLAEETQLKKQMPQYDYRPEGKRSQEKQKYIHNFKIIDSQADEEINRANKHFRSSSQKYSSESQEQFDELIDRFQRIKSKSKNLT